MPEMITRFSQTKKRHSYAIDTMQNQCYCKNRLWFSYIYEVYDEDTRFIFVCSAVGCGFYR